MRYFITTSGWRASVLSALVFAIVAANASLIGSSRAWQPVARDDTRRAVPAAIAPLERHVQTRISDAYGRLPSSFEANRGQTDSRVQFLSRGRGHTLFLTSTESVVVLMKSEGTALGTVEPTPHGRRQQRDNVTQTVLRMTLVGANARARVAGRNGLPGKANYLTGNDPRQWHPNVPTYAKVQYQDLYPGIDLVYYGNHGQLEYDFVVRPGANPHTIRLDVQGADTLDVDARGDLVLQTAGG